MKLFLHSGDLDEIRQQHQRGVCSGVTVADEERAGQGQPARRAWLSAIAAIAPSPVCVTVAAAGEDDMTAEAMALGGLAANIVVGLPPTAAGLAAMAACTRAGFPTQLRGYRSPADVEFGARAGAQWFTPALDASAGTFDVADMVRVAVGARRVYARSSPLLVGPLRTMEQAIDAGAAGAEAASVTASVMRRVRAPAGT